MLRCSWKQRSTCWTVELCLVSFGLSLHLPLRYFICSNSISKLPCLPDQCSHPDAIMVKCLPKNLTMLLDMGWKHVGHRSSISGANSRNNKGDKRVLKKEIGKATLHVCCICGTRYVGLNLFPGLPSCLRAEKMLASSLASIQSDECRAGKVNLRSWKIDTRPHCNIS